MASIRSQASSWHDRIPDCKVSRPPCRSLTSTPAELLPWHSECKERCACWNYEVLLAVQEIGHGSRVDSGAELDVPKIISRARDERNEVPVGVTAEHQIAGCRKGSSIRRREILESPFRLAGERIEGLHGARRPFLGFGNID